MKTNIIYVLDTSVLLYDPKVLNAYPKEEVVIPIDVIEEIDKFKEMLSETGNNARIISHMLDQYRSSGNLSQGVTLSHGGQLRVMFPGKEQPDEKHGLDWSKSSNRVLRAALNLKDLEKDVVLITLDTHLRVKANAVGIQVKDYHNKQDSPAYSGIQYSQLSTEKIIDYQHQDSFQLEGDLSPNEGIVLMNDESSEYSVAVYNVAQQCCLKANHPQGIWDIIPRNAEQHIALDLLLNPDIPIVTLIGKAGTGKTLLALACGLQMMLVESQYKRLLVSRPIFPMGRDLGYLPGDLQEKLAPWMQPIFDNLELLLGSSNPNSDTKNYQELIEQDLLVIEPLTYIRGRSIPHQYMIVDEAQNLTPHEIKTIITRVGEGTKIVLTGDPDQIDNPYVNKSSNGLSYIVEKFKNHKIAGHVTLKKGERSSLAELAANIL